MTCSSDYRPTLPSLIHLVFGKLTNDLMDHVRDLGYSDLSLGHFLNVLRFVSEQGIRPARIARNAGVTPQAVSLIVADLERRGYVERSPDPEDRRAQLIRWAPKGRDVALQIEEWFGTVENGWRRQLGDAAVDGAIATLQLALTEGARR